LNLRGREFTIVDREFVNHTSEVKTGEVAPYEEVGVRRVVDVTRDPRSIGDLGAVHIKPHAISTAVNSCDMVKLPVPNVP
jgi:hypothetical protein